MLLIIKEKDLNEPLENKKCGTLIYEAMEEIISWIKSKSYTSFTGYIINPSILEKQLHYLGNERTKFDCLEEYADVIKITSQIYLIENILKTSEKFHEEIVVDECYNTENWKDFHIY